MSEWRREPVAECLVELRLSTKRKLQTQDYRPTGRYPIVDQGQSLIAGWTDDDSGIINKNLPLIVFGDHTRIFKFVDFPFVRGADGTQILKPKADIHPLFFYFALQSVDLPSRGYNRHFKALKEKEISVPEASEQSAIAHVLKLVNDGVVTQDEQIQIIQQCKHAAMRVLFTRGLRGEPQKETEIGPMPESWQVVGFQSIRQQIQYGTSSRCTYEPTGYPVLRIPNIESGRISVQDMKFGSLTENKAARYRLEEGDLVFIRTNGVIARLGACAVFAGEPKGALFASYLIRARLRLDRINPYYAAYFLGSELGTNIVAGRATPASDGKYNLNTGTIDDLPIPLPPTLDEQIEIVTILNAIDRKIDLHRRKRTVLNDLFKTLLHKLMTGEIRVDQLDLDMAPTS